MHIYGEIEYYRKSDGQSVHSDICYDLEHWQEDIGLWLDEIKNNADLSKGWTLHGGNACTVHNKVYAEVVDTSEKGGK